MWMDCTPTHLKLSERFGFALTGVTNSSLAANVHSSIQRITSSSASTVILQENCSACSQVPQDLQFPPSAKLQEVLEYLTENASL